MHTLRGGCITVLLLLLLTAIPASESMMPTESVEHVAPREEGAANESTLRFGSQDGSNFLIAPGTSVTILVNLTNEGNESELVNISIESASGWGLDWTRNGTPEIGIDENMEAGELIWIEFRVHVPEVVNGMPLAGSRHNISVMALPSSGESMEKWNFTIEVEPVSGIEIVSIDADATIDPGHKLRLPVEVRNLGNRPVSIHLDIQATDAQGTPLTDTLPTHFLYSGGWAVGVFDEYKIANLAPNESGVAILEYAAPFDAEGEIHIRVLAQGLDDPFTILEENQTVRILRIRDASLTEEDSSACERVEPGQTCVTRMDLENLGNLEDSFTIHVTESPSWASVTTSSEVYTVSESDTQTAIPIMITIDDGSDALETGSLEIEVRSGGVTHDAVTRDIQVAPVIDWALIATQDGRDGDNVIISITIRNEGNDFDGVMVALDMDVDAVFGLIPPEDALHSEAEHIRYFECRDIDEGMNMTFQAYSSVPEGFTGNGTATLELTVQSIRDPQQNFSTSTNIDYTAVIQNPIEKEETSAIAVAFEKSLIFLLEWNGLVMTVVVVAIGSILLNQALVRRQKDLERMKRENAPETESVETVSDWTKRFSERSTGAQENVISPAVESDAFVESFRSKSKRPVESPKMVDQGKLSQASDILDRHEEEENIAVADNLVLELLDEDESTDTVFDLDL